MQGWQKQTADQPLFADLLWSRPENRQLAGKLLIIGGQSQGFSKPAEAFSAASQAGAGSVRVMLPNSLYKRLSKLFPEAEYLPSTPSGSFAQSALSEVLASANWSDAILFAGDLGRNSETSILIEKFLTKHNGAVVLSDDAINYLISTPQPINNRDNTYLVLNISQLQKLATGLNFSKAFTSNMDLINLSSTLADFSKQFKLNILLVNYQGLDWVSVGDSLSSTPNQHNRSATQIAASAAVWIMQHPGKNFESISSSLVA